MAATTAAMSSFISVYFSRVCALNNLQVFFTYIVCRYENVLAFICVRSAGGDSIEEVGC